MLRNTFQVALVMAVLLVGCANLEVYPVNDKGVKVDQEGIPYYLPQPILIVGADLSFRIEYIPDLTQKYIIQATNAGTFERTLTLTQGWQFVGLTESGTDTTSEIIGKLIDTAGGLLSMSFYEPPELEDISLKPGLYYFEFSSGTIKLIPILN
ncbi:hypothetical protein KAU45_07130 [bacterium]|nr:hypothetical protein [bacterium]